MHNNIKTVAIAGGIGGVIGYFARTYHEKDNLGQQALPTPPSESEAKKILIGAGVFIGIMVLMGAGMIIFGMATGKSSGYKDFDDAGWIK